MENFSLFDSILLVLLILLGLKGLMRGLIQELFALIGIIGGIFIASRTAPSVGGAIDAIFSSQGSNTTILIGFILSFATVWGITYLLGKTVKTMFSLSGLGIFDRVFGFLFGSLKIFLLFSIIAFAFSKVDFINKRLKKLEETTILYPLLIQSGHFVVKIDTEKLDNTITNKLDTISKESKKTVDTITTEIVNEKIKNAHNKSE